jgi:hypothetical protein
MIVTREEAVKMMYGTSGRIFSATFKKSNGEVRHLVGRVGVRKGVKGVGLNYIPEKHGLMTIFDMQKDAFRMINKQTLMSLKIGGVEYEIK